MDKTNNSPLPKSDQIVKEDYFEKIGVFARQIKVNNIYKGIEDIASIFGFSGVDPNTIMMGWPKGLDNSEEYSEMTQKLLYLDYNLLYLDFDKATKFGNYQTIDLWWRETDSKNAEMMLNIARFIIQSPKWRYTSIKVLFVNNSNVDSSVIESNILNLVEDIRVKVEIKIINNAVEQIPFYDLITKNSLTTDLTLLGIPNFDIKKQAQFVTKTNQLFESIGSTLMVKASKNFNEINLNLELNDFEIDDFK